MKKRTVKICPRTGKVFYVKPQRHGPSLLLPVTGLVALVRFLIRVIPKPGRATYFTNGSFTPSPLHNTGNRNNATARPYSRNLKTGEGIELVTLHEATAGRVAANRDL